MGCGACDSTTCVTPAGMEAYQDADTSAKRCLDADHDGLGHCCTVPLANYEFRYPDQDLIQST